jgi:hypothetical protein
VVAASDAGTGVELDSEAASVDSVTLRMGAPFMTGAGDGTSDVFDGSSSCGGGCDCGCGFSSNCASSSDESRRTTGFDGFFILSDLLVEVEGDRVPAMVLDMAVVMVVDGVKSGGGWFR